MTGRDKHWGEFKLVSFKQMRLALAINGYRREHQLSQKEMAHICSLFGEPNGVKFFEAEISQYELMNRAPRKKKYDVLCNVLNLNNSFEAA